MIHDVLIVGAGPAGSLLAYLLASSGCRVALLDKELFPREKVCGGGLSNKSLALLRRHGIDIASVVQRRVQSSYLAYRNRDPVVRELDAQAASITVLRSEFDHLLLQAAISAGAGFHPGCTFEDAELGELVRVKTSQGTFSARYLIGADGVFSQVRNRLFGRRCVTYAPALEALVEVDPGQLALFADRAVFDFGAIPAGYGWIFPKKDHLNVGVFSAFGAENIRASLDGFMSLYGSLRNARVRKYLGFAIPCRNETRLIERGNVWLIGDAAGFAEALFGEGIYFALWSAELAAECLRARLAGAEGSYTDLVSRRGLFSELSYSQLNGRLLFAFPEFAFYHMVRNERLNLMFANLLTGHNGHKRCFYQTLALLPWWALSRPSSQQIPHRQAATGEQHFYVEPNLL